MLEEGLGLFHHTQQYYKDKLMDVQSKLKRSNQAGNFSNYELDQVKKENRQKYGLNFL